MLQFLKGSTRPVGLVSIVSDSDDAGFETASRFAETLDLGRGSSLVTVFSQGFESWVFDHHRGLDSFLASVRDR